MEGATLVGSLVSPATDLSELNGKTVKATGYYLYINGSSTKYANILVTSVEEVEGGDTPVEPEVEAISKIKAGEEGVEAAIEGVVVAISTEGFLVKDDTGLMLAYVGSGFGLDVRPGTLVKVKGTTAIYGGVMQLSTPTYTVKGFDDSFAQPEARVLDLAAYEAMPDAIGIPEEQLREAAKSAVCKINIDSDLRLGMTAAIRKHFAEHPDHFDPRQYLSDGRNYVRDVVRHKIKEVLGSEKMIGVLLFLMVM